LVESRSGRPQQVSREIARPAVSSSHAYLDIVLAMGNIEGARRACGELRELAQMFDTDVLRATASQGQGAIELPQRNASAALGPLGDAFELWQRLEAPCESARVRVLIGQACGRWVTRRPPRLNWMRPEPCSNGSAPAPPWLTFSRAAKTQDLETIIR
jgi:hypothetical protein